jgi:hypothetical protein
MNEPRFQRNAPPQDRSSHQTYIRKAERVRPGDLPKPLTKESALAQIDVCRAYIADITGALSSKTAAHFPSQEAFADWRDRTLFARSQWESKLKVVTMELEAMRDRESLVRELTEENARLRAGGASERIKLELKHLQDKARRRRVLATLERHWLFAILSNDAPPEQRELALDALRVRINSERYQAWLARAKAMGWQRHGPTGRFDAAQQGGNGDEQG